MGWDLGLFDWFRGAFANLWSLIWCAVKYGMCELQSWAFSVAEERIIDPLLEWVPAPPPWAILWLAPYYHTMNYFFPVSETVQVMGLAITFWMTCFSIRFLWRFVGLLWGR